VLAASKKKKNHPFKISNGGSKYNFKQKMKAKETYLKGKSVFTISLIVIGITILTVYLSGINYNRTITSNLYLSLGIIGICLFIFYDLWTL